MAQQDPPIPMMNLPLGYEFQGHPQKIGGQLMTEPADPFDGEAKPTIKSPHPKLRRANFLKRLWYDWWLPELLFAGFTLICLALTWIVLLLFHSKSKRDWPGGDRVTLNTVLSVLATGIDSALLLVVASAMGQLKWVWFTRRTRTLEEFEDFDRASRGPLGGLKLLGTTRL